MGRVTYENDSPMMAKEVELEISLRGSLGEATLQTESKVSQVDSGTITVPLGDLEPGEKGEVEFSYNVPLSSKNGKDFIFSAFISSSSYERNPEDNLDYGVSTVATAEMAVRVYTHPSSLRPEEGGRVKIVVSNHGLEKAEDVYLVVDVDSSVDWRLGNYEDLSLNSNLSPQGGGQEEMTFHLGSVEAKESAYFRLIFVPEEAPGEIEVTARTGTSSQGDSWHNNRAETTLLVEPWQVFVPFVTK